MSTQRKTKQMIDNCLLIDIVSNIKEQCLLMRIYHEISTRQTTQLCTFHTRSSITSHSKKHVNKQQLCINIIMQLSIFQSCVRIVSHFEMWRVRHQRPLYRRSYLFFHMNSSPLPSLLLFILVCVELCAAQTKYA